MTWYIAAETDRDHDPEECVWSITRVPGVHGWNTDMGYPGYGLPKAVAQFLADAANEKEARDGPLVCSWREFGLPYDEDEQ